MARAPSCDGKSRLVQALGVRDHVGLRTALLRDTFTAVEGAMRLMPAGRPPVVVYTPPECEDEIHRVVAFADRFIAQRGDTLGARMRHAIQDLLAEGFGPVVLVGSDLPTLPAPFIVRAFEHLAASDDRVVLGPAEDGGYYLIGLRQDRGELFIDIPWGTADVLRCTRARAEAAGLPLALLPTWYDVDEPRDLRRVRDDVARRAASAPATTAWLADASRSSRLRERMQA